MTQMTNSWVTPKHRLRCTLRFYDGDKLTRHPTPRVSGGLNAAARWERHGLWLSAQSNARFGMTERAGAFISASANLPKWAMASGAAKLKHTMLCCRRALTWHKGARLYLYLRWWMETRERLISFAFLRGFVVTCNCDCDVKVTFWKKVSQHSFFFFCVFYRLALFWEAGKCWVTILLTST